MIKKISLVILTFFLGLLIGGALADYRSFQSPRATFCPTGNAELDDQLARAYLVEATYVTSLLPTGAMFRREVNEWAPSDAVPAEVSLLSDDKSRIWIYTFASSSGSREVSVVIREEEICTHAINWGDLVAVK